MEYASMGYDVWSMLYMEYVWGICCMEHGV